jgi:hypothetical protein
LLDPVALVFPSSPLLRQQRNDKSDIHVQHCNFGEKFLEQV